MNYMILLPVVLPVIVGFALLFLHEGVFRDRRGLLKVTGVSFAVSAALALYVISGGGQADIVPACGRHTGVFCG